MDVLSPWIFLSRGIIIIVLIYFLSLFILCVWERVHKQGRGRERGRENPKQALLGFHIGLEPMNCEIMTWTKTKSQMLNWLSHPGTSSFPSCFDGLSLTWLQSFSCLLALTIKQQGVASTPVFSAQSTRQNSCGSHPHLLMKLNWCHEQSELFSIECIWGGCSQMKN